MGDSYRSGSIRSRHWAIPLILGLLALVVTSYYGNSWVAWQVWFGYGLTVILGAWAAVNFVQQAVAVGIGAASAMKQANYQLSGNYLADRIREMNSEQLQTLRMYGSTVIQYLVTDDDEGPVGIIFGTQVSLAFALYFLTRSNERATCPIRDFMDGTYHWDWTGENRIQDRTQAREFTSWLIRYGYAETKAGNISALWRDYVTKDGDQSRWSPEKVLEKLGMAEEEA